MSSINQSLCEHLMCITTHFYIICHHLLTPISQLFAPLMMTKDDAFFFPSWQYQKLKTQPMTFWPETELDRLISRPPDPPWIGQLMTWWAAHQSAKTNLCRSCHEPVNHVPVLTKSTGSARDSAHWARERRNKQINKPRGHPSLQGWHDIPLLCSEHLSGTTGPA